MFFFFRFDAVSKKRFILSDQDLWRKFLCGEDESITIVYNEYVDDLFSYGLKIVNDESLVMDCIQEVFINIIRNGHKFSIKVDIHVYLFRALRNKLFNELRLSKRKREILNNLYQTQDLELIDSVEKKITEEESSQRIKKEIETVIKSLTDKQREIIYLKFTEDLSYEEIAKLMEIDTASARTLLYRTLKVIKEKLGKRGLLLFLIFNKLYLYPRT